MAVAATLPALLESLTQSLTLAQEGTSKLSTLEHPKDGISLLDVKNELLLSYLQNLVFLILVKLRNARSGAGSKNTSEDDLGEAVREKLVELRLYLEKGARPLEEKLRFSIERFLRTAEDAKRKEAALLRKKEQEDQSGSEDESDADEDEEDEEEAAKTTGPALQLRPGNMSAAPNMGSMVDDVTARPAQREDGPAGVYRPPRRERQVMETTQPREKALRRPMRSQVMDEFVASELSGAPVAEPSIGTTIVQGGRRMKTDQERRDEAERREYEESNFVRLPKESKKDKAKAAKAAGRHMQFGGEEWRDLGEGVDRIDKLTKRKQGAGGVRAMLEKSRKRGHDTTDGPRGSGHHEIGDRFNKRVRMMEAGRGSKGKKR
ncbi:Uncharacterized protein ESCO_003914 [Escovopsis weberi]|uniref:Neuroguidin n=1 Tax=Escovopsis weberi TaxID=150374 RepID=A0A0M9VX87_ESCWE|nr:Uncharacterized protein ESCO_003914 [Escovopsis weberi]